MKTVKWTAKSEYEWVANFKIAQKVMTQQNVAKPVPIDKLVKGKYQDNLEFLQWFKHFFESRFNGQAYDAAARRALGIGGGASGIAAKPATTTTARQTPATTKPAATTTAKPAATTANKKPAIGISPKKVETPTAAATDGKAESNNEQKERLLAQIAELEAQMLGFEKERDFYFGKLREVEIFCQTEGEEFTKERVLAILYKTDDTEEGGGEPAAAATDAAAAEPGPAAGPEETF